MFRNKSELMVVVCALSAIISVLSAAPRLYAPSADASQNQLSSPTTGTVSGLQLTNNLNNALDSLNTANSGATAPVNQLSGAASLGNWWLKTASAPYPLGMNDGSSNWPAIGYLDPTNHYWDLQVGGGTANVASAATTDPCGVPQYFLTITGTTTITSFGSTCPAGTEKVVQFSGALTLTYNAASLIIPGAANVLTSGGDIARLLSLGSGNWQVEQYSPANGQALINPAVDVGTYILTSAVSPPSSKYLLAYGQAVSRTTYATLMSVETITQSVSRTISSPTLSGFSDTTQIPANAPVEGNGIPTGTTISSCTPTQCTMSQNASSTGTGNVTIFPNGNGDGATTFNLPDCRGVVMAGRDNMGGTARGVLTSTYTGNNPDALGSFLSGGQSVTIALGNLPAANLAVSSITTSATTTIAFCSGSLGSTSQPCAEGIGNNAFYIAGAESGGGSGSPVGIDTTVTLGGSVPLGGSGTPISNVQPSLSANCMMRVLAMLVPPNAPNDPDQSAANDNQFAVIDGRRTA